ncbi:NUDIX domain-containing protein [Patescibacteria group bacterium]|nr:NUDIX domain-containing protein [Patescibacteria group bacterium]
MPHIHEKVDFTAEVFIVYQNRVLLRFHDKYHIWLGVGGHIELDEDPTQAAVREVKEEVGLDITLVGDLAPTGLDSAEHRELLPPRFMNRHRISDTHEHVTFTYFGRSTSDNVVPDGDDISNEWHWLSEEELSDPAYGLRSDIILYAREALRALKQ